MRRFMLLGLLLFRLAVSPAEAAHTQVKLLLAAETIRPGETVMAGLQLKMDPRWHTYWRNPGGAGIATKIEWTLPAGITAGEIQWPIPEKILADDLTTYNYSDEVVLLVPLTVAANAPRGIVDLKGTMKWLECDTSCIPGKGDVQATLTIGTETKPSPDAALIETWRKKLPRPAPGDLTPRAAWEKSADKDTRPLVLEWHGSGSPAEADFFPYASDNFEVGWKTEVVPGEKGVIRLRKQVKKFEGAWPSKIAGILVQHAGGEAMAYAVEIPIETPGTSSAQPGAANAPVKPVLREATNVAVKRSLLQNLLYAFLGGLILNVMPCVLPVIALKILGFVNQGGSRPGQIRKLGIIYAAGVLVSFLALAGLVIAIKQAGHRAGWGMQFSNPQFIVVLTVLVTLVALNLFGLFEVNLSGKVLGAAGQLSAKEGNAGAFFNGVLATILATPCTAPFLGVALGFAFTQSYPIIVLVFLTAGLGLAAPYVILSWNPAWLKLLPKPGAWMEKFKIAMGFPMLATAFWLFQLTPVYYGERVLWLGLFLVIVGLAAWMYGEFIQRGRTRKPLAAALLVLILLGGYVYAIEDQLNWRNPMSATTNVADAQKTDPEGIDWLPWSPAALAQARTLGRPILVDFTAKWCQTCNWNLAHSIDVKDVRARMKQINAIAFVADYTRFPDNITDELAKFERAGVPLVLVYPRDPNLPPEVMPDGLLTQGIVLKALDKAARTGTTTASVSRP